MKVRMVSLGQLRRGPRMVGVGRLLGGHTR